MSVIIYAEAINGEFKKTAFEIASYASKIAGMKSTDCIAVTNADQDTAKTLANYGVDKILCFSHDALYDGQVLSAIIASAAHNNGANTVILTDDSRSKAILGRIAVKMNASVISGANSMLSANDTVSKSVFSAKALAEFKLNGDNKVISLARNSVSLEENPKDASIENLDVSTFSSNIDMVEVKRVQGTVPLPEAELVVSAGRGMKGPENWGIIEELAETLGATTACSRPVSDSDWRPHHEHVGQTGIAIKPNLYIAIGISGAIQHLAGVNNSKTIVVINKDAEAPFFKAADYGVVADLFDVVPRLNEAIKKFKSA